MKIKVFFFFILFYVLCDDDDEEIFSFYPKKNEMKNNNEEEEIFQSNNTKINDSINFQSNSNNIIYQTINISNLENNSNIINYARK